MAEEKDIRQTAATDCAGAEAGAQAKAGAAATAAEAGAAPRRSAVITGASRGIGAACARELAACGMNVIVNFVSPSSRDAAQELASSLNSAYGVKACALQADVSRFDEAHRLVEAARDRLGSVDVLVNNAGIVRDRLIARMSEEDFDQVVAVNLKGAFNCIRHAAPLMMKQRYGRIVSISSVVGLSGNAGQANYAAAKAGLVGLTKSVAKELGARNVTANAVAPGFICTDMTTALPDRVRSAARDRIARGAFGTPEDVARAVAFFACDETGYVTGQVLSVDGGLAL